MDEIVEIYKKSEDYCKRIHEMQIDCMDKLRAILYGDGTENQVAPLKDVTNLSPEPEKKRVKHLSALAEYDENVSPRPSRIQNSVNLESSTAGEKTVSSGRRSPRLSSRSVKKEAEEINITKTFDAVSHTKKSTLLEVTANFEESTTSFPKKSQRSSRSAQKAQKVSDRISSSQIVDVAPHPKDSAHMEVPADFEESTNSSAKKSPRSSRNAQKVIDNVVAIPKSASELMPPPLAPVAVTSTNSDQTFSRPQRAAKLNCEKHLKEPTLRAKLRRPINDETMNVQIKLEHEQRVSQMHEAETPAKRLDSTASTASQHSVVVLPPKEISIVSVASDIEPVVTVVNIENAAKNTSQSELNVSSKQLRVRIKREKLSISFEQAPSSTETRNAQTKETEATNIESSMTASVLSTTTSKANTTQSKKGRKKKVLPMPIKVERFSDCGEENTECSVASRTRKKKNKSLDEDNEASKAINPEEKHQREVSIYQEALENLPASKDDSNNRKSCTAINETITITKKVGTPSNEVNSTMVLGTAPNDATYCTASAATFVLEAHSTQPNQIEGGDLTFNVANEKATDSRQSSLQSMETARDTLQPHSDSLITEDESFECPETPVPNGKKILSTLPNAPKVPPKPSAVLLSSTNTLPMPTKASKMPPRTIEIFNPLIQSPVKKKVEAYENAAAAQAASTGAVKRTRSKQAKENCLAMGSNTTPIIGKLTAPALGRFLTPTQSSNTLTPNVMAQAKIIPASASKATITKSNSAGNLKATASSAKPLTRGNSADDFRKGLHQMAEERKKQREQKHLLAAQQREAKERERAERLAKVAKEREEKRLIKQKEAELKKRELEEIQKKLRAQEEAAAAEIAKKKAKILAEQEKVKLMQMKAPNAPASEARNLQQQLKNPKKYTFEMLHEDDSTDDETKTSYKRPPPPLWSLSRVRGAHILKQQVMPTAVVDSFFSVQPMTPDLKTIFPAIDPRYLKRNSSAFWSTPPRYSELPKY